MEKKKYEVVIADVEMAILSDEREDFVMRLVGDLDQKIRQITLSSKRCSKMDAALLVALDTAGEKLKADKRIRNLEAQIGLYDANLRRLREENAKLKEAMLKAQPVDVAEAPLEEAETEDDSDAEQLNMEPLATETEEILPATEETKEEEKKTEEPAAASRGDKLRQIESLLRGKNNG
ncbi:MAG: cell division protein ZapA [Clostridiales bacterium]|jgi:cell division protein ZapA (FtsZ GTPase activity inhibitor)|nr:cell division protein ZapA [Clostridiales bacterium]